MSLILDVNVSVAQISREEAAYVTVMFKELIYWTAGNGESSFFIGLKQNDSECITTFSSFDFL